MPRLVNIAYQGNTHGNFLRYFIDRFSALTPEIAELPFLSNGNSHNPSIKYSGLIHRYHPEHHNDQYVNANEPHVLITITEDDIPYLHRLTYTRAGDNYSMDLRFKYNDEYVEFTPDLSKIYLEKIKKIYNLKLTNEKIILPKYIARDFLKLHFLDINKDGILQYNTHLKKIAPENTFFFPVDAFWSHEKFLKYIKECNVKLNLNLNIDETATDVHQQFLKRLHNFQTKDRCKIIFNKMLNKE